MQIAVAAQELAARQAAEEASKEAYELDMSAREASLQEQISKMNLTLETLQAVQQQAQFQTQLQAQFQAQLLSRPWYRGFMFYGALFLVLLAVLMTVPASSSRASSPLDV